MHRELPNRFACDDLPMRGRSVLQKAEPVSCRIATRLKAAEAEQTLTAPVVQPGGVNLVAAHVSTGPVACDLLLGYLNFEGSRLDEIGRDP